MVKRAMLEAHGVSYAYTPGHWAVRNIDLEVAAGARVALLGANGGGQVDAASAAERRRACLSWRNSAERM